MRAFHCICALLLLAAPAGAQLRPVPAPPAETRTYIVFLRGTPVGREEVSVRRSADGMTLTGRASIGAPVNLTTRRAEVRYRADWSPESMVLEGTRNMAEVNVRTTFRDGTATSEGTDSGRPVTQTQTIGPRTFVLPNMFFGAQEAVGRWLAAQREPPGELRAFVGPGADVIFRVAGAATARMQAGTTTVPVRIYELRFANPTGEIALTLTTTDTGSMVRLTSPAQGLDVVREDLATALGRTQLHSNPGDEPVMIPGPGFNFGATLTRPKGTSLPARLPAVVLLSAAGANDRDGVTAGVPILGQIAGSLADAGFLVVRYDKRGFGQSGGRAESATLSDYAEDARTIVNWLRRRADVDEGRIALVGHSDGAWVALLAASRERRVAAVATLAAPSVTGTELVLEQQQLALEAMNAPPAEREQKIALQKKIQAAVLTGAGWEGVPPELKRQADTPWFQSLLAYDPAAVIKDVRQPMLVVHGQLDKQVPVAHAERLASLARKAARSRPAEVVTVRGVNHLLIPAVTGEVPEYRTLTDRNVSREVTTALSTWLTRTFAATR